jgi:hypothetical protein
VIAFLALYNKTSNKPVCACLRINDHYKIYELYRAGIKKPIIEVKKAIHQIKEILLKANDNNNTIITNNFKQLLISFDLPIDDREYNVYDIQSDVHSPLISSNDPIKDIDFLVKATERLIKLKLRAYQKAYANASVVYQDLENKGLFVNDTLVFPKWSLQTYSGRSKSLDFNIQGYYENDRISSIAAGSKSVLLHFDWISADLRMASLLSQDKKLQDSFIESDPYTVFMESIRSEGESLTREESKLFMLRSINSMDVDASALMDVYPGLCKWINKIKSITQIEDGYAQTLLGRKFKLSNSKNALAVLNGAMQGSVAHAMHIVLREVWCKCPGYVVADIHDSLVLSIPNDPQIIKSVIDVVVPIMMFPFKKYCDDNPCFPLKVSIGNRWKHWKLYKTYRF